MSTALIAALVVDDDSTNREMSAAVLEALSIYTDKAESGKHAIKMCRDTAYNLIFMDLEMPEMDGYETAENIRCMGGKSSKATIVALTATLSSKDQVIKCLNVGMKDCMVKPLDAEDIKERLKKWKLY